MSAEGVIFDVKELAVHDGPGPRTTVFFKGCPLRCKWCHNPEGLSFAPQLMVREARCTHCGRCRQPCSHPECQPWGRCLHRCPLGLVSVAGQRVRSDDLARRLLRGRGFWGTEGGVTVSGGEPLGQPVFLAALLDELRGVHRCVETCGFAPADAFDAMTARTELVLMDIKLMDDAAHRHWTGQSNVPILRNFDRIRRSGHPVIVRIPLIPGVNDSVENLTATAEFVRGTPGLIRVELLPFNPMAGAKYAMIGAVPTEFPQQTVNPDWVRIFTDRGIDAMLA